jgi:hypothetical protein
MTEAEMKTLREMFVDVAGAMAKSTQEQTSAQFQALEKSMKGQFAEVNGKLDVLTADVSTLKADIANVKRDMVEVKESLELLTSKRLARIESRLDALEQAKGN